MSSSRKLPVSYNTSTYGGGTRQYTSLATWEAATDNDLVAAAVGEVLDCYDDAASFNDYVTLMSAVTNSSYFRVIRAAAGNKHDGTPNNGFNFLNTAAQTVININEAYAQAHDLIIVNNVSSAVTRHAIYSGDSHVVAVGCICKGLNAGAGGGSGIVFSGAKTGQLAVNCLAFECKTGGIYIGAANGQTNYVYNCTAVNNSGYGIGHGGGTPGGTVVIKNCLSALNTGADFSEISDNPTENISYCATEDATADDWGGSGNRVSQTFSFVNSDSDDWHLTSSDAGARDYGTDLSGDSFFAFNDDLDSQTRSGSWDIGADEYVVAGGSASLGLDALLKKTGIMANAGLDACLRRNALAASLLLDGMLRAVRVGSLGLDALLLTLRSSGLSLDALLRAEAITGAISLDAMLRAEAISSMSLDAILRSATTAGVDLNGLLRAAKSGFISFDALLRATQNQDLNLDGMLLKVSQSISLALGALLRNPGVTISINFDAMLRAAQTGALSLDGLLRIAHAGQLNLDAILQGEPGLSACNLDSFFCAAGVMFCGMDALIFIMPGIYPRQNIAPPARVAAIAPPARVAAIAPPARVAAISKVN